MKVVLDAPPEWRVSRDGSWTTLQPPDHPLEVIVSPLVGPASADPRGALARGLAPGWHLEYLSLTDHLSTTSGWPMAILTAKIFDGDNHERGVRFAAIYRMTLYLGVAMATLDEAAFATWRDPLRELYATARPDLFRDDPSCVAELFTLEEP